MRELNENVTVVKNMAFAVLSVKLARFLREAEEANYWLELLFRVEYLFEQEYKSMHDDCVELCKLLMSIVKSTRK